MRWVMVLFVCVAATAHAHEEEEARRRYTRGTELYQAARYEEALAEFSEAHRLSMRPALLFNIGVCNERLGRVSAAIAAFERYLVETPAAPDHAQVKARIDELRARQAVTERPARKRRAWIWGVVAGGVVLVAGAVTLGVVLGTREDVRVLPELRPQ